jgi:hypothetical protein
MKHRRWSDANGGRPQRLDAAIDAHRVRAFTCKPFRSRVFHGHSALPFLASEEHCVREGRAARTEELPHVPSVRPLRPWILAACIAAAVAAPAIAAPAKKKQAMPAAPKECRPSADEAALHVRALKEEMMVGALSCDSRAGYNAFVRKFEKELNASGNRMKAVFRSRGGTREMDIFNTKLANEAMRQHMEKGTPVFCADSKKLFEEVLALPTNQLPDYAVKRPFPITLPVKQSCPAPRTTSASTGTSSTP